MLAQHLRLIWETELENAFKPDYPFIDTFLELCPPDDVTIFGEDYCKYVSSQRDIIAKKCEERNSNWLLDNFKIIKLEKQ